MKRFLRRLFRRKAEATAYTYEDFTIDYGLDPQWTSASGPIRVNRIVVYDGGTEPLYDSDDDPSFRNYTI